MWEHLHQRKEQVQEPPGVRMLKARLSSVLGLILGICATFSLAHAQNKAGGACATKELAAAGAGFVDKQFKDHQEWLEKYKLTKFEGPEWVLPDEVRNDPKRAKFGCLQLNPDELQNGFTGRDWRLANFAQASLAKAYLIRATLIGADFSNATLENVPFMLADLRWANFAGAKMANAQMWETSIANAIFEPDLRNGHPKQFEKSIGYEHLKFLESPAALIEIRELFKKSGRRDIERQLTFAIETSTTLNAYAAGDYLTAVARYTAWKLPTEYELEPTRALLILLISVIVFAVPYYFSMSAWSDPKIWRVLPKDRIGGDDKEVIEALRVRSWQQVRFAVQFSIYSAFQLGWRDLNVGTWLSRLQAREYMLRGSGWVRTLSGAQSLLSVYLLAMWALTQFGRLFE